MQYIRQLNKFLQRKPRLPYGWPIPRTLFLAWGIAVCAVWALAFYVASSPAGDASSADGPVKVLAAWDGEHFADVAVHGYSAAPGQETTFAFFPLLPIVSRIIGGAQHAPLAGILLNQLCLLGTLILLGGLAHTNKAVPLREHPAFWLLVSPLSFFLSVYYAESLFLFLTLVSLVAYRKERFALAFAAGFLAGLSRPTAITLPALFLWATVSRYRQGTLSAGAVATAFAPWAGLGSYLAFVGFRMGDPLAYLHIHSNAWDRTWSLPFRPILRQAHTVEIALSHFAMPPIDQWFRVLSTIGVLALLVWGWRKIEPGFLFYTIASLLFVHSQFPFGMTGRYEMVLFPLFILMSQSVLSRPRVAPVAAGGLVILQVILFLRHSDRLWVS